MAEDAGGPGRIGGDADRFRVWLENFTGLRLGKPDDGGGGGEVPPRHAEAPSPGTPAEPGGPVAGAGAKPVTASGTEGQGRTHPAKGRDGGSKKASAPSGGPLAPGDCVIVGKRRYVVFADEIRVGGSVAWRVRNPGNIREGDHYGAYPGKKLRTKKNGSFAVFPDEATGMAAVKRVLKGYGDVSILAAMRKYAPKEDGNDPEAYAAAIAKALGTTPETGLGKLDDGQLQTVTEQIKRQEGWKPGTVFKRDDPTLPEELRKRLAP